MKILLRFFFIATIFSIVQTFSIWAVSASTCSILSSSRIACWEDLNGNQISYSSVCKLRGQWADFLYYWSCSSWSTRIISSRSNRRICSSAYEPVCATDITWFTRTYSNRCIANNNNARFRSNGRCSMNAWVQLLGNSTTYYYNNNRWYTEYGNGSYQYSNTVCGVNKNNTKITYRNLGQLQQARSTFIYSGSCESNNNYWNSFNNSSSWDHYYDYTNKVELDIKNTEYRSVFDYYRDRRD
jgi:hypothetical protein